MNQDIFKRCIISADIAGQYEAICREKGRMNDPDRLCHLSIMETLKKIGLSEVEIHEYMEFVFSGGRWNDMLRMLTKKRDTLLEDIHRREEQISQIDYLKFRLERRKAGLSGSGEAIG